MGNKQGFTDRLDYVFLKNGARAVNAVLIGNKLPQGELWATDHAGLVVKVEIPENSQLSPNLNPHNPFPISFWNWVGITFLGAISLLIYSIRQRRNKSR